MFKFLRDPALHFVTIGCAIFLLQHFAQLRGSADSSAEAESESAGPKTIFIEPGVVEQLSVDFEATYGRPPTETEAQHALDGWIENEVLAREAIALGLDQDDLIIQRRLVQKMSFVLQDSADVRPPTDDELDAFIASRGPEFRGSDRFALTHIFISRDLFGDRTRAEAQRVLDQVRGGADPTQFGIPFARGQKFGLQVIERIASIFGAEFSAQLAALPVGEWSGPISSTFGEHIVMIDAREPASEAAAGRLRADAMEALLEARRTETLRASVESLKSRYRVVLP